MARLGQATSTIAITTTAITTTEAEAQTQVMKLALLILVLAWFVISCAPKKQPEQTKDHGFLRSDTHLAVAKDDVSNIAAASKEPETVARAKSAAKHLDFVGKGIEETKVDYNGLLKQVESGRQQYFRLLDYSSWIAGIALAVGGGLIIVSVLNGGKIGAGIGIAAVGGAGVLTFMVMRAASPVLVWVAAGVGGLVVIGCGYFVWDRIKVHRKLRDEQCATQDVVEKVPSGVLSAAMPRMSSTSRKLLNTAKDKAVVKAQAESEAYKDVL